MGSIPAEGILNGVKNTREKPSARLRAGIESRNVPPLAGMRRGREHFVFCERYCFLVSETSQKTKSTLVVHSETKYLVIRDRPAVDTFHF